MGGVSRCGRGRWGLEYQIGGGAFEAFVITRISLPCRLILPKVICTPSSLAAVITTVTSSIETPVATICLPLDNTAVAPCAVEQIPQAVVDELFPRVEDSQVNLGLVFPWNGRYLLDYPPI